MAYSTVNKSSLHFNTKLYTGTGSSNSITGIGFQPDKNWTRKRTSGNNHVLTDAVRGATYTLYPDLTNAQGTQAQGLTSFDTDGFTVGTSGDFNDSGVNYVSWNWKFNGSGSSNTDGTITTTVSYNSTAKMSIVKWTSGSGVSGIGHGLGAVPKLIICKNLSASSAWVTGSEHINDWGSYMAMDSTASATSDVRMFKPSSYTAPTSSVFYQDHSAIGSSGEDMIAYCFANNPGFFKHGVYTGNQVNGGQNAPFIYTGFAPSAVWIKTNSTAGAWVIIDNKRSTANGFNLINKATEIETSAEQGADYLDFYSNGFKIQTNNLQTNNNNTSHYWWAFGQTMVGSNNIPCNSR